VNRQEKFDRSCGEITGVQRLVVEHTLGTGGWIKVTPRPGLENLAAEWRSLLDDLVARGLARKSRSGRYWGVNAHG